MIPYGRQFVDDDDIEAVIGVLKGDWLTQGPSVEAFEQAVADLVDARHAVAFSNGTAALHGAAAAAGLGAGDRVATTPLTFVASANCARYVGADVELADIDPTTLNIDLDKVPATIDGLVAVHDAGLPVDLRQLAVRPRVIIEDASHALGATTPDGPVGNCAHSDLTTFSFHPVKPITTGEGGLVTTNDDELARNLRRFRTHGIERRTDPPWAYDVVDLGFNYRLSDIQAALGSSQLLKLDRFRSRREELSGRYDERLAALPIELAPAPPSGFVHGRHIYPVRVEARRALFDHLIEAGVRPQVHYVPVHHHTTFDHLVGSWPEADRAYDRLLSLPLHPTLTDGEQDTVIHALEEFFS